MNKRLLICMILFGAVARPAFAEPAHVASRNWALIGGPNSVEFLATGKPGFLQMTGRGAHPEGQFQFTENAREKVLSGSFKVNLNDFDTGIQKRNEHMKSKYLETDKFPTAQLFISEMRLPAENLPLKEKELPFKGRLNLHGVEKEISGLALVSMNGQEASADVKFSIHITDFKIAIPVFLGVTVADKVDINARILARAQESK